MPASELLITACLLGIIQVFITIGAILAIRSWAKRKEHEITERIREFVEPRGENHDQPSILAEGIEKAGAIIGSAAARSLKAQLLTAEGHTQRQLNELQQDAAMDAIEGQQPILGGILSGMGRRTRKRLLDNPVLVQAAMSFLGNLNAGKGQANSPGRDGTDGHQTRLEL